MKNIAGKFALGTVQFGLKYGINNSMGKPSQSSVYDILTFANKVGIEILDTADAYGNASDILGKYLTSTSDHSFHIVTKFKIRDAVQDVRDLIKKSMSSLCQQSLYCYMYHDFDDYSKRKGFSDLVKLREEKTIQKIGVSIYSAKELEYTVKNSDVDLIQLPFNVFDSCKDKRSLLAEAKKKGIEIHTRSVFLQGLLFMDPIQLKQEMSVFIEPLKQLRDIADRNNTTIEYLALNYAFHQDFIDRIVIGVESIDQINKNLNAISDTFDNSILEEIKQIRVKNKRMLNPSNWRVNG